MVHEPERPRSQSSQPALALTQPAGEACIDPLLEIAAAAPDRRDAFEDDDVLAESAAADGDADIVDRSVDPRPAVVDVARLDANREPASAGRRAAQRRGGRRSRAGGAALGGAVLARVPEARGRDDECVDPTI